MARIDSSYKIIPLSTVSVSSVTEYYRLSANTTETFDESTISQWSTTPSAPTSQTPNLLNAELISYTDGSKQYNTAHVVSKYTKDGRGIAQIKNAYRLSAEATPPTAPNKNDDFWDMNTKGTYNAWGTICPATNATYRYLWNCERIYYSDDTYDVTPVALNSVQGINGTNGKDGADGKDGLNGADGKDGKDGLNGQDGYSPTFNVSTSGGRTTITLTDRSGTTTGTVTDGENGQPLKSRGEWSAGIYYKILDVVHVAATKKSYICKSNHWSGSSFDPSYWDVMNDDGNDGASAKQYYIHFVYNDSLTVESNYSTTQPRKYMGVYTDTVEADAQNFADANAKSGIVWSKVEGVDGVFLEVAQESMHFTLRRDGKSNYEEIALPIKLMKGNESQEINSLTISALAGINSGNGTGNATSYSGGRWICITPTLKTDTAGTAPSGIIEISVTSNSLGTFQKKITITSSKNGKYLGRAIAISGTNDNSVTIKNSDNTSSPVTASVGDFITWIGTESSSRHVSYNYQYIQTGISSYSWAAYSDDEDSMTAFSDIMSVLDDATIENEKASLLVQRLVAAEAFIKKLFANQITLMSGKLAESEYGTELDSLITEGFFDGVDEERNAHNYYYQYSNFGRILGAKLYEYVRRLKSEDKKIGDTVFMVGRFFANLIRSRNSIEGRNLIADNNYYGNDSATEITQNGIHNARGDCVEEATGWSETTDTGDVMGIIPSYLTADYAWGLEYGEVGEGSSKEEQLQLWANNMPIVAKSSKGFHVLNSAGTFICKTIGQGIVSGSFANDVSYLNFDGGLEIQWGETLISSTSVSQSFHNYFSAPFSSPPKVFTNIVRKNSDGAPQGTFGVKTVTTTGFTGDLVRTTEYTLDSYLQWFAIGYKTT